MEVIDDGGGKEVFFIEVVLDFLPAEGTAVIHEGPPDETLGTESVA